jgi:hypothetical protein
VNEAESLAFVQISAQALGIPLDAASAARVAAHLQRTAAMAKLLESATLSPADEPAEIFCPKPH